jgi:hypothetical protein
MTFDKHNDHKNNGPQKGAASTGKSAAASKFVPDSQRNHRSRSAILEIEPAQNSTPEDLPFDMVQPVSRPVVPAGVAPVSPTQPAVIESKSSDEDDIFDAQRNRRSRSAILEIKAAQKSTPEDLPFDMVQPVS